MPQAVAFINDCSDDDEEAMVPMNADSGHAFNSRFHGCSEPLPRLLTFRMRGPSTCLSACSPREKTKHSDSDFGLSDHQLTQLEDQARERLRSKTQTYRQDTFRMRGVSGASDGELLSDALLRSDSEFGISDEQLADAAKRWTVSGDCRPSSPQCAPAPQVAATFHGRPSEPFRNLGLGLQGRALRDHVASLKKLQTLEEFIGIAPAPLTSLEDFIAGVSLL